MASSVADSSAAEHGVDWTTNALLWVVDAGILGVLFVAPYFMGGRHPVGRLVLVAIVAAMAGAWALRQCLLPRARWRSSAGQWLLLAAVAVLVIQLTPLPSQLFSVLSPDAASLLPLWSTSSAAATRLGDWAQVSLYPAETAGGLAILLAYGLAFLVTVQRVQGYDDVKRIIRWIAMAAIAMAGVGLAQYLTANGKFLWIYEHPFRQATFVQGPFINRNHFCHLLALGVGPICCWLVMSLHRPGARMGNGFGKVSSPQVFVLTAFIGLALVVVLFTGLLTYSRGGVIVLVLALVTVAALYFRGSLIGRNGIIGILALALLIGASLTIHGVERLSSRIGTLTSLSLDKIDRTRGRRKIWEANGAAFASSPWLGRGVGTHRAYNEIFLDENLPYEYSHAESGPLQIAGETGVVGLALLLAGIGTVGYWCWTAYRRSEARAEIACAGAIVASLSVSLVHSAVDFVWYIPACMSWAAILCALACRLYQLTSRRDSEVRTTSFHLPRVAWGGCLVAVLAVSFFMLQTLAGPAQASGHWDRYLKRSKKVEEFNEDSLNRIAAGNASESLERQKERDWYTAQMAEQLRRCVARDSANARAHLRLASIYLQQFQRQQQFAENSMELMHIREAAIASKFPSRESLDEWLERAVGPHRILLDHARWHARRAVSLCPLQGEGYLFLAELCFLGGGTATTKADYVDQALQVRPHNSDVLLAAGREAAIVGDVAQAAEFFKRSFHSDPKKKRWLIGVLAQRVPPGALMEILVPDATDFQAVYEGYRGFRQPDADKVICDYFYASAERQLEPASENRHVWCQLSRAFTKLKEHDRALASARNAYACDPYNFDVRLTLGTALLNTDHLEEAEGHFRWCVDRRPNVTAARERLKKTVKMRIGRIPRVGSVPTGRDKSE